MLIDGKEVFSDEKQSSKIQQDINKANEINPDLQSEYDPRKALKDFDGDEVNSSDFNVFFDDLSFGDDNSFKSRKNRYDMYRQMDTMEFIHRGLELISDDSSQLNDENDAIKVYSDEEEIKDILMHLFVSKLDMNNELWSIFYETIKMGDNFYEIIVDDYKKPKEIKRIRYLNPEKVERIENNGRLSHFVYRTNKDKLTRKKDEIAEYRLFPWQIIHFKIEDKDSEPYGGSLLASGARTFKRLTMLEDIMLVYRISRAPERRVFYIDVGNLNAIEAKNFLRKMKNSYRSQSFIDEDGNINKKANVMSITSDIFVPVREGSQGTRIETLQAGQAMGASGSEDPLLEYFKNKILKTMNIPPQYMGEQADRSRALSQLDQKFGRFIERVQAQIIKGLNKIAALELFFKGYKKEDLENFKIELTPPSNVKEITEIDMFNQRMSLIATIQQLGIFTNEWILRRILKMSDREIADIQMQKKMEALQQGGTGEEGGGEGGDMSGGLPGEMPDLTGGEEGEETPAPEGGEEGEEAPAPEELTASVIINKLGKEFLIENKNDFLKLVKHVEDKNKETTIPMFESISELVLSNLITEKPKPRKRNGIFKQIAINELRGLNFNERNIKIYNSNDIKKDMLTEEVIYEEKTIECGNPKKTEK